MATAPERAADYHDYLNPADAQALSSTIARLLISKTPAHAKAAHPVLTPEQPGRTTDAMDMGTAVHQLLLRDDRVDVLDYDSFRTNDAKAARDQSRLAGRIPLLRHKWEEATEIAARVREQIVALELDPVPFTEGTAEHVIRWEEHGVQCRAMLDWLRDDLTYIDDLKTTVDASPAKFARHIFNMGYDIQAAFYTRAVRAWQMHPEDRTWPVFRWVVVETKPPYPVTIHTLSERAMHAAQVKVDTAIQLWNECTKTGVWPAYPNSVQEVDIPGWVSDAADEWADVDLEEVPF